MPASRRTSMLVWKKRWVVKTGSPTKRSSPCASAIISEDIDISLMSKSPNLSWRQKISEGCDGVMTRSTPSTVTLPSISGQVRGLAAKLMLSCSLDDVRALFRRDAELLAGDALVPVEDLRAVPMQHAVEAADIIVDLLEIFDPVRLPADIGVDRQRHDLRAVLAFVIQPVELILGAPQQVLALVVLHDHHGDVVDLDRVGQGDERPLGGADHGGLVGIDAVARIFRARTDQDFGRLQRLGEARSEPADRPRAGEALEDVHRAVDHLALVLDLVDRHLVIGMAHELPAELLRLLGDPGIVLAGARVHGERRPDAQPRTDSGETRGARPTGC